LDRALTSRNEVNSRAGRSARYDLVTVIKLIKSCTYETAWISSSSRKLCAFDGDQIPGIMSIVEIFNNGIQHGYGQFQRSR
jgi:hypothetical protein